MIWPLQQLRRMARIRNGSDHSGVVDPEGAFPVYGSGGEFARASSWLYRGPAVLLGRKGTIDKPLLVDGRFWTVDTMFCAQPLAQTEPRFLYYACTTIPFGMLSTSTALPSMTQSDLNAVRLPCPPIHQQVAISNFLDHETAKIDDLISKQERLIATLREDRVATITHAITKGIDPRAEMKNTAVEWIGKTVCYWDLIQVRAAMDESDIRNVGAIDQNYLSLMANVGVIPYAEKGDVGNKKPDDLSKCKLVKKDDFVINSMNYQIGSYGISEYDGVCSPVYIVLRHKPGTVEQRYALRIFETRGFQKYAQSFGNGILEHRRAISWNTLKNLRIPHPPIGEQRQIVAFLDDRCAKIDELISKAVEVIQNLGEYRSALITDAVTGKIDLQGAA